MREIQKDLSLHPCFNPAVKGQAGRVHLPVAPNCNIKCNYCDRKYDCVNESRPGVTSTVLSPDQALVYLGKVLEKEPRITVAGIAGPGDPFANAEATMETMRLIDKKFPKMILCLASNGLAIGPHVPELAELNVSHVTITINAVDPEVGAKIYGWVRDGKVAYRGRQAAELLLSRQLAAVKALKAHGITVKINSILIPGVNDQHILQVAETMKALGADLFNCMAMFPNAGTPFGLIREPSKQEVAALRSEAEKFLPQMRHCTRCRADAVGLLDQDRTGEMRGCLSACAALPVMPGEERPYVAVASMEGVLVNQHLGGAILIEQPHRIGPAAGAMAHLGQELLGLLPDFGDPRLVRLLQVGKGGVDIGEHRHAIEKIGPQFPHLGRHRRSMMIVDSGDDDEIDLDRDPVPLQGRHRRQLAGKEQFRRRPPPVGHLAVPHPGIDLFPDRRVHRIDRDGHVGDLQGRQLVDIGADSQPVAGQTEEHGRKLPPDQADGLHGLLGIGKGVARPGDPGHRDPRLLLQHPPHIDQGLAGGEDGAGHPGPRLVDAVIFAVAEITLDIALGRHRQMDPAALPLDSRIKTRMLGQVQGGGG